MRCFAEVSMNRHPKCLASSRPSDFRWKDTGISIVSVLVHVLRTELTMASDLPLVLQIALVCYNDDGKVVLVLYSQNLLVESEYFVETVPRGDAVNKQKAFSGSHVLLSHCPV
jgi:hypothetical protein